MNNLTATESHSPSDLLIISWSIFTMFFVCIQGSMTNFVISYSIMKTQQLKFLYLRWVFLLSVYDGVFCLTSPLIQIVAVLLHHYTQVKATPTFCRYFMFFYASFLFGSPMGQAIMALFRFLGVFCPLFYTGNVADTRTLTVIWISVSIFLPTAFGALPFFGIAGKYELVEEQGLCTWEHVDKWWRLCSLIVFNYTPASIILIAYPMILLRLHLMRASIKDTCSMQHLLKNVRSLCLRGVAYMVMLTPSAMVTSLGSHIYKTYPYTRFWIKTLYWCTFSTNPVGY